MSNMDSNIRSSSQVRLRRESIAPNELRKHDEGERLNARSPVNEVGDNKLPRYDPSRPASRSGTSQPDPPRPGPSRSISRSQAKTPGGKLTILKYIYIYLKRYTQGLKSISPEQRDIVLIMF